MTLLGLFGERFYVKNPETGEVSESPLKFDKDLDIYRVCNDERGLLRVTNNRGETIQVKTNEPKAAVMLFGDLANGL